MLALADGHFHLLLRTGPSASSDASRPARLALRSIAGRCRAGPTPLSKIMRRLMTGYAVTFNKRHTCPLMPEHSDGRRERSGHLFQNRPARNASQNESGGYKSIVCEEDPYLLELIRYIHLNPLRAGIVNDLKELDKYPWTGHSALLGKRKNPLIAGQPDQESKK